ncbi:MAG: phage baseplate protein [Gammaproteobacteria bacterium]|nr:phage baseplate protein [Gammaproteobacteria bacterium]
MKALGSEELLNAWEQGLNKPLLTRILILLAAAYPEIQADALAKLSIGQRDLRLLQLRTHLFGQRLLNTAVCPECGERIEWESNTTDFIEQPEENSTIADEFDLNADNYALRFRLPNSLDITTVINTSPDNHNAEKMQQHLLSRCLLNAEQSGKSCDFDQLPDSVIRKLSQQVEQLDSCADIRILLNCSECSHSWTVLFDIAGFLWTEVNEWAQQILQTVYKLASGYGWSEQEILRLSPVRRQLYLGMLG